jgi:hypothetical protein
LRKLVAVVQQNENTGAVPEQCLPVKLQDLSWGKRTRPCSSVVHFYFCLLWRC